MTREEVRQVLLDAVANAAVSHQSDSALQFAQTYTTLSAPEDYVLSQYSAMEQAEMQRLSED